MELSQNSFKPSDIPSPVIPPTPMSTPLFNSQQTLNMDKQYLSPIDVNGFTLDTEEQKTYIMLGNNVSQDPKFQHLPIGLRPPRLIRENYYMLHESFFLKEQINADNKKVKDLDKTEHSEDLSISNKF